MKRANRDCKIQRALLLERLKQKPCSTFEARHELDIPCPAARAYELRHHGGYNIQTLWTEAINPGGGSHRVAQYVLLPGIYKRGGGKNG